MISPIDAYFQYVAAQMAVLQAKVLVNGALINQPMGGVVNARDWPATPANEGALYLLFLNANPSEADPMVSQSQMAYEYFCQWVWMLIGTDITNTQQAQSRSDRYRANFQIIQNLRQANYPGFCQKKDYSADPQTGAISSTPSASLFPVSSIEMVTWSNLKFMPKSDNDKSGLVFGAASVDLHAYDDVSILVA